MIKNILVSSFFGVVGSIAFVVIYLSNNNLNDISDAMIMSGISTVVFLVVYFFTLIFLCHSSKAKKQLRDN